MKNLKVYDCKGQELIAGSKVKHVIADQIHHWGDRPHDFPSLADGSFPTCVPFQGVHTVVRPASSTCVELEPTASRIPVFLGCTLERVG